MAKSSKTSILRSYGDTNLNILKLYTFFEQKWVENGVGDMKVLKKEEQDQDQEQDKKSKYWLLMRNEETSSIILNHLLTSKITFKKSSPKSLTWTALDFSYPEELKLEEDKGKGEVKIFSVRFKNESGVDDFLEIIGLIK